MPRAVCLFFFLIPAVLVAQKPKPTHTSFFVKPGHFGLTTNTKGMLRHSIIAYPGFKVGQTQVISIKQPGTQFDYIYFVDKYGNSQYQTIGMTSQLNQMAGRRSHYDSFNPYGSRHPAQGIVTGLINTFLQSRGVRSIGLK